MEGPVHQPQSDTAPKDQETCRICRGESTQEEPLFHPCKCSGSIKYVHQDCLDEWLKHSKKPPVCELCNTSYRFTKLYDTNMPTQVPVFVYLRKFAQDLGQLGATIARCFLVFTLWVVTLPMSASQISYIFTFIAESIPYNLGIYSHPIEAVNNYLVKEPRSGGVVALHGFIDRQISSQIGKNFILDVMQGQVIILVLVLVFFVVMIVREWILQNDVFVNQLRDIGRQPPVGPQQAGMRHMDGGRVVFNDQEWNRALQQQALRRLEQEVIRHQAEQRQRDRAAQHDEDDWDDDEEEEEDENHNHGVAEDFALPQEFQRQFGVEDQQGMDEEPEDGILEFIGVRGPLTTLLGAFFMANLIASVILSLLYFVPYCTGRVITFAFFNRPASWAKYGLQAALYYGNEVFYQGAKFVSQVLPIDLSTLEQEALQRHRAGLVYRAMETKLPGQGLVSRVICTMVGHSVWLTTVSLYASSTRRFSKTPETWNYELALLRYIAQAQAILKVVTIIGIELVVFPIFCGVLLVEVAFDPLYPDNVGVPVRIAFTLNHPITGTFTHWAVGTCYMFLFAMFVSLCRKIMRPGVLYFVRDPNDPNFHPIRDVLDRPLVSQLGKIGISAVIYSILIVVCIGGVMVGLRHGLNVGYLPLRLTPILSEDQLFTIAPMIASYNLLLPILVKIVRSLNIMRKVWEGVFSYACYLLRLSSFILNKPIPQEQGYVYYGSLWARLRFAQPDYTEPTSLDNAKQCDANAAYFVRDGRFVRAPNTDAVTTKVKLKMFVEVTKDDDRLDGVDNDGEHELTQYNIVYRPPWFKVRVAVLLLTIWLTGVTVVFTVSGLPLIIGRTTLQALFPKQMLGDLVYYGVGIVPVAFGIYFADNWAKVREFLSTEVGQMPLGEQNQLLSQIKRAAKFAGKLTFSAVVMFTLFPMMLGVLADLYIAIPATMYFYSGPSFEMSVVGSLLHGLAIIMLVKEVVLARFPDSLVARKWREMTRNGWTDYDMKVALLSFVLPIFGITIVGWLLPISIGWLATHTVYADASDVTKDLIYKFAYPAVLLTAIAFVVTAGAMSVWRRWQATVRDDAYMVGRQLQNM